MFARLKKNEFLHRRGHLYFAYLYRRSFSTFYTCQKYYITNFGQNILCVYTNLFYRTRGFRTCISFIVCELTRIRCIIILFVHSSKQTLHPPLSISLIDYSKRALRWRIQIFWITYRLCYWTLTEKQITHAVKNNNNKNNIPLINNSLCSIVVITCSREYRASSFLDKQTHLNITLWWDVWHNEPLTQM